MNTEVLRFKGLSISKEDFEQKYHVKITDIEWKVIVSTATREYEENIDQYKLLVFRFIRSAMDEAGYKVTMDGPELKFKKVKE